MGFALSFDDNEDLSKLDQGERVGQPGWYLVDVEDTHEDDKTGARVMKYRIVKGASTDAYNGLFISDYIHDPELSKTPDKKEMSLRRAKGMAKRLGVIDDSVKGQTLEPDWLKPLGTQVVLKLKEGATDGKPSGYMNVDFMGVYQLTNSEIPDAIRKALALPPAVDKDGKVITKATAAQAGAATTASGAKKPPAPSGKAVDVSGL